MSSQSPLLASLQALLKRRESHSGRRKLTIAPPGSVDFSSNDFLSLSRSKVLREDYFSHFRRAAELPLGSGGSRLLDGNSAYVEDLEKEIASFHNAPSGLFFNSGFDANSAMFSCIPQPGDVILYDEYIHASVHEGMRLSRAGKYLPFRHNCVADFEHQLQSLVANDALIPSGKRSVFVALETVYSMDGDVSPVAAILDTIDRVLPKGNGHVIVDEAHSTGIYGPCGRGLICHLGLEDRILARLHTFGKALSSGGGIFCTHSQRKDLKLSISVFYSSHCSVFAYLEGLSLKLCA
ncbi:MAG: hypothetical protein M1828_004703 [Chrysothrix sp. TS-e1954]|nr:MAG: hypothetical protein M1828_004703 [Chrysothrix sp. TS-e1954]